MCAFGTMNHLNTTAHSVLPRAEAPPPASPHNSACEDESITALRELADRAFLRASGAHRVGGNRVRLLTDARENYPAWLDAIAGARHYIYFESYIIHEDDTGRMFADALIAKAREGVRLRLVYDWLGGFGRASGAFWDRLRAGGVEVRCYNPLRLSSPLSWLSRDHRKMLSVDGRIAFVSGLCVGRMWAGIPEKNIEPWRDTGIEVRGPAVADIEEAFADVWAMLGEPIPESERADRDTLAKAGDVDLRIVASVPATAGMLRLDQLVATLARHRLWLADAYYTGTTGYIQALRAAAKGGVDVRLLVPNATDVPLLRPLSRTGYKPLLEAGVRVFEWNGTMMHAKTAVADGNWARVGSTNLNIASWLGNCELDVVVEDEAFAREMEDRYLQDLSNATEIVLNARHKVGAPGRLRHARLPMTSGSGSAGRAAAGVVRIGNVVGAAVTDRRELEPVEARLMAAGAALLLILAVLFAVFPPLLVYPLVVIFLWSGLALLHGSWKLYREGRRKKGTPETPAAAP